MSKRHKLSFGNEYLFIKGQESFILIGKAGRPLTICIEANDAEYCQGLSPDDIIAVSAPEGGLLEPAIMLLELVRTYRCPLVVLPKGHPGSKRLRYVVSAGERISMSCSIERGTHPEQHILCASGEFADLSVESLPGGVIIGGSCVPPAVFHLSFSFPEIKAGSHQFTPSSGE